MKIHSDTLGYFDFQPCVPDGCYLAYFYGLDGVNYHVIDTVGSRQRKQAFVVRLSGSSKSVMQGLPDKAATYDEWGYFLAEIFKLDPEAICGPYKGVEDFHAKTDWAYFTTEASA